MTKCVDKNEFDLVNYLQTKYFIDTLRELNMIPKQFIFISTLSVFGPVRERTYDPIMESDPPSPNTAYGLSKLKTELICRVFRVSPTSSTGRRVYTGRVRRIIILWQSPSGSIRTFL